MFAELADEVAGLPLPDAHRVIVSRAVGVLPFAPTGVVQ